MTTVAAIGSKGLFQALGAFSNDLKPGVQYTCVQVSTLAGMLALGDDPWDEVYKNKGISRTEYDTHLWQGESIIALQAADGALVKIPMPYIAGTPDAAGVTYRHIHMVLDLGVLPATMSLAALKETIVDVTLSMTGLKSVAALVNVGPEYMVTAEKSAVIEALRAQDIQDGNALSTRLAAAHNVIDAQSQAIAELEQHIIESDGG